MKNKNYLPISANAKISIPIALSSFVLAVIIEIFFKKEPTNPPSVVPVNYPALILVIAWVVVPPIWFIWEWHRFDTKQKLQREIEDFKYGQELARNVWIAFAAILGAILHTQLAVG